ncbi:hypothetical protein [Mastigocoleus testarum]|uniref:Sugar ABC transporter permease n=1 Tax=Mastigocoleus testarum BC008 TaxID=371196 RepID=A0A0V7ZV31_9CYAN|nr:hypothetical protein [Mastigocoleus testarum]KST68225.1 sugar ABC transporter permease [Mastigocoleus testarum BC008]
MATTSNVEVTISLSEPDLDDEELQAEAENLLPQIREVDGVEEANLITLAQAPTGSKAFGGFAVGKLKALVNPKNLGSLFKFLGDRLGNKTIKVIIKKSPLNEEITVEATNSQDFELAWQKVENRLNNK